MRTAFSWLARRIIFAPLCLLVLTTPARADQPNPNIVCRPELSVARRQELADKLRVITGWTELHFDADGRLHHGDALPADGSQHARALLAVTARGQNMMVLEDASGRADVAFSRVVEGRWKQGAGVRPPVFVVLIDFADFTHLMGDADALAAFNVGWGLLHEIDHVVHDSADPAAGGANPAGECEDAINRMRRECGLAERVTYFYTLLPGSERSDFKTRYVRLAFERTLVPNQHKRYWLFWDATQIGGLPDATQIAAVR